MGGGGGGLVRASFMISVSSVFQGSFSYFYILFDKREI